MSERITIARLKNLVDILKRETRDSIDYELDGAYNGYRLVSNRGSHDVSPRLSKGELYEWIHAFRQGVEIGKILGPVE
jgi:hypothetical protein